MVESRSTLLEPEGEHDPATMQQVSQAMIVASSAMRRGASDAQERAENLARQIKVAVGRSVYSTCYCLSYGIVFPTMFVAKLLPLDNAVGRGLCDGASAARRAVDARAERRELETVETGEWSVAPAV